MLSANDLSFLAPYHRVVSKPEEQPTRSNLEQRNPVDGTNGSEGNQSATTPASSTQQKRDRRGTHGHQRLVFSDPVAFRYLEEDPATVVLDRRRRLEGYEIYVVEQWACSRVHPTFIICTYTGDPSHSILVSVLGVPVDESAWSTRLKVYFQAVSQFHARTKETPLGSLMVTNLSGFPSTLTVIAVPDGDVKKHREDFIINENLKRMGCSGRAAMNLQAPQQSTVAKFYHLYRTNETVPLYTSVMEVVRVCQIALIIFGKLQPAYADGLLCDITEKAINDWWTDIGSFFHNLEPTDGILGPTTVAALLGLLIGAYNRLKAAGAPVGKDVLDLQSLKRAVGAFQRTQKLERTRRLDRQTLDKLHRTTAKTASGEGWNVQKAVKSTVAELSGKGGEMVMGMVGAREKAGIAEVETLDLDRFVQLVSGARMKWLWQGKPMKSTSGDLFGGSADELNGRVFSTDDQGNFIWTSSKRGSIFDNGIATRLDSAYDQHAAESKTGLGRLRDAVGISSSKSQHPRQIKEEDLDAIEDDETPGPMKSAKDQRTGADHQLRSPGSYFSRPVEKPPFDMVLVATPTEIKSSIHNNLISGQRSKEDVRSPALTQLRSASSWPSKPQRQMTDLRNELKAETYQNFSSDFRYTGPRTRALRRSQSAVQLRDIGPDNPRQARAGRHLSFSAAEEPVLTFDDVFADESDDSKEGKKVKPIAALIAYELAKVTGQKKAKRILNLQQAAVPWTESLVDKVESLDFEARQHLEELNGTYYQRLEEYQSLRMTSTDVVGDEKGSLTEGLRRVEMQGAKLDYELNALQSRVQEVELGLGEFERNVVEIEGRVRELTVEEKGGRISWFYHFVRFFGGGRSLTTPMGT